ncbi:MAG: GNAT family N-acetyltransferase [Proteobacteria bacterium]|nr:GNAT family N-acetyltransferase [Pseudomonadota bacterium]MDA1332171.1 GNAT family N-acetyltransferase [Pseudomonadota bacterium]
MSAKFLDLQPILKGDSIYLRPLRIDDAESLYEVASDPLIWEQHPSPLRYKREVFDKEIFDTGLASKSTLVVVDSKTKTIIGSSRYYDVDINSLEVAIGFTFLERSHWGGIVNAEMKDLMLSHAFNWAKRIWFHVGINNIRSQKAMEKSGANLSHRAPRPLNGIPVIHCYYFIDAR